VYHGHKGQNRCRGDERDNDPFFEPVENTVEHPGTSSSCPAMLMVVDGFGESSWAMSAFGGKADIDPDFSMRLG
jgi:hypothetical protein